MPAIVPLLQADDAVRIAHVRAPRWISHPTAGAAHAAMQLLLQRPPSLRPRGLLLAGPYHNGKTMIAERFAVEHLRTADQQKVWVIQTREGAGLPRPKTGPCSTTAGPNLADLVQAAARLHQKRPAL